MMKNKAEQYLLETDHKNINHIHRSDVIRYMQDYAKQHQSDLIGVTAAIWDQAHAVGFRDAMVEKNKEKKQEAIEFLKWDEENFGWTGIKETKEQKYNRFKDESKIRKH